MASSVNSCRSCTRAHNPPLRCFAAPRTCRQCCRHCGSGSSRLERLMIQLGRTESDRNENSMADGRTCAPVSYIRRSAIRILAQMPDDSVELSLILSDHSMAGRDRLAGLLVGSNWSVPSQHPGIGKPHQRIVQSLRGYSRQANHSRAMIWEGIQDTLLRWPTGSRM